MLAIRFYKHLAARICSKLNRFNFVFHKEHARSMLDLSLIIPTVNNLLTNEDNFLRNKFFLESPEKVLSTFQPVHLKIGFSYNEGTLYVTEKHLLFSSLQNKILVLPFAGISKVEKTEKGFVVRLQKEETPRKKKDAREKFRASAQCFQFIQETLKTRKILVSRDDPISSRPLIEEGGIESEDAESEPASIGPLTSDDWTLLLSAAQKMSCQKGDVILKQGEKSRTIFFLVSGALQVIKQFPKVGHFSYKNNKFFSDSPTPTNRKAQPRR